jgi:3(or 17)beta-hydroxysteroid dehydrogenase
MGRVESKVAIITGAASGLGRASARLLAKEGAKVVIIADINEVKGKAVAKEIKSEGGNAIFIRADVRKESDWKRVIERTLTEFDKLDILVNNAGVLFHKKIEDMSLEEWRELMSTNLDGVFLGTKHAIGAMKRSGGGSIINMSSAGGIVGTAEHTSAYCASKGGVRLFTKAAALECSKSGLDYNIRVNSVHPGGITTPMTVANFKDRTMSQWLERYPVGHPGEPIVIAYGVLYLASDESKFVTGAEMVIDGGWTAK